MSSVNLGQLTSATWDNARESITDNIFNQSVLLNHLKNNDGIKIYDGGDYLREPLLYGSNSSVQAFSGADILNTDYQEGIDTARYLPKFYNVSIVYTAEDKLKNKGKSQIFNLLKAKIKQAELSLSDRINEDLFNGASSDSKEITGLDTIISTSTTLGEISGSTYSWWRGYVDSSSEALSFSDMRTAKNTVSNGAGASRVSLIVTTQTLYEKMFSLLTANYYMNSQLVTKEGKRLADASYESIQFEGVPVTYDTKATTGSMYFINKDNLKLGVMDGGNFETVKTPGPYNQHLDVSHILFVGQTIVNRRSGLGLLSNKTA